MAEAGDRATAYARDVAEGRVVAGRLVRLACSRHLADLEAGQARGLSFDAGRAAHAIGFIERYCRLAGGDHEGRPFLLQPWQSFVVGSLFGWKGADGYRRFRSAYIEIGKGNGKSPLAAAIGLYMLVADGEARAEVYAAATKKEQAAILFRDAVAMVRQSPDLAARLEFSGADGKEWNIAYPRANAFFRTVSADKKQSGPRPHCALIDEIHEHDGDQVVKLIRAGTKGRRQALTVEITNSGHDRESVCWHHHEYTADILLGKLANDSWFSFVCGLDACPAHEAEGKLQPVEGCPDCDDWRDEGVWRKANPNLGVSIHAKYLREQVAEAEGMPSARGTVLRLNFCVWTEAETAWLSADLWARGAGPLDREEMKGLRCYGGIDVASKIDVAAFVLAFPDYPEPGQVALLCRFWIPAATAREREHNDGIPYSAWQRAGWITLTPGDGIDLDIIEEEVKRAAEDYHLVDVGFDDWNAQQMCTHLMGHGISMVRFGQNLHSFNEPSKEFQLRLKQGRIKHGDDAVLKWMAGNVSIYSDASGNIRPVKPKPDSHKKVDGIVASVMALARLMFDPDGGGSVYDSRGIVAI